MKLETGGEVRKKRGSVSSFCHFVFASFSVKRYSRKELEESRGFLVLELVRTEDISTTVSLGVGKTLFLASERV